MDPLTQVIATIVVAAATAVAVMKSQMGDVQRRLSLLEPEIAPLKVAVSRIEAKLDILLVRWNHD